MHFGRRNAGYSYQLDTRILDEVIEEKDLGITITSDLKAFQQCTHAYSKANKLLGVINRSIIYKSKEILIKLYKSLVRCVYDSVCLPVCTIKPERLKLKSPNLAHGLDSPSRYLAHQ